MSSSMQSTVDAAIVKKPVEFSAAAKATAKSVLNAPWAMNCYYKQLSEDPKTAEAPEDPEITGDSVSEAAQPIFEQAAQSNDTILSRGLRILKIGQALLKVKAAPPFWAVGFASAIPEEDTEDDEESEGGDVEEDSPNQDADDDN